MALKLCLAGATGWAGSALARAIATVEDVDLVASVSRSYAGQVLGDILGVPALEVPVFADVEEALKSQACDVYFDYTKPEIAKANCLAALDRGSSVVIGTSGLTEEDFEELAERAEKRGKGVLAVGNFALTVVLLQRFAEIAARFIPQWEIIDYASDAKRDAPSGTTRELAARLAKRGASALSIPLEETQGPIEARGTRLQGSQIHSLRLPGYSISAEIIFGMAEQRLSIRHDAGSGAEPYVEGALLAIRKVGDIRGLKRGLDSVMDLD
ncbi:MAG TPA: 4-hydroxy-tetrahydrodipicolinate reductase [Rectinemataceae bacterium]|nr:4-hydroxy-tetrahydrodipicolinate reductase [Rectinemataceae bacterium]